ncbi:hypothetical protein D3OALGB2SA_1815 [Olavius algarvensis associated proteobacterium Delta 3]|nr:hypothetical protein D3OALGB2SA_1815 [Olavius algarvensis associated proteobacterium Delta 3]
MRPLLVGSKLKERSLATLRSSFVTTLMRRHRSKRKTKHASDF